VAFILPDVGVRVVLNVNC